jgi:hypothetical protein
MRQVEVTSPSFPDVPFDELLTPRQAAGWQVVCGDAGHWRAGIYSPAETCAADCSELERHDCPELFLLLRGRLTLLLFDPASGSLSGPPCGSLSTGVRELVLEPWRPVLVRAPHNGFCPDGPHTGVALVVERDALVTEYRTPAEWQG